jgi:hypothetical protein
MNDILILSTFTEENLSHFIGELRNAYDLNLTISANRHSVNFLDCIIAFSSSDGQFYISPYSKNHICFPLPSLIIRRSLREDIPIIYSQIFRTYRISTNKYAFSQEIVKYVNTLKQQPYYLKLRESIYRFLLPIQEEESLWNVHIPLCHECQDIILRRGITICKIMRIIQDGKDGFMAIRCFVNCLMANIHILI